MIILKIGGRVATWKNRPGLSVRRKLLGNVAASINSAIRKNKFDLILIHGAGAAGHQLAHKYGLSEGAGKDPKKWRGSFLSRIANHKLDLAVSEILISSGLRVTPTHTASVIIQKDKKINSFDLDAIRQALRYGCIPLLYGEMVFDESLGMTICSGDTIACHLALELGARKILFASDIDGIYSRDPHIYRDAKLIEKISLSETYKHPKISKSHNIDVTGGLGGKIKRISEFFHEGVNQLETIEIFNGLQEKNYKRIILSEKFPHTTIQMKKAA